MSIMQSEIEARELKKRHVYERYQVLMGDARTWPQYELYLLYLDKREDFRDRHLDNRLNDRREELIVKAVLEGRIKLPEGEGFLKDLLELYEKEMNARLRKEFKKSNLVMLGRGWVKAGFDFGKFNEDNFRYDASQKRIVFIGFSPEILSATINPWFIPEKGVEGFEFLVVQRRVRRDYNVVKDVKQMCLDELVRKAFERDILQKATENAEASLREFFSLIMDVPIAHVGFYQNELLFALEQITKNDSISGEELIMIEHLLGKTRYTGIDTAANAEARQIFIDSLRNTAVYILGERVAGGWAPQWAMAYEVVSDGAYDAQADEQTIRRYSQRYVNDSSHQWQQDCAQEALAYIQRHVAAYVWHDSTGQLPAHMLQARLSSIDSLYSVSGADGRRQLSGFRLGLDDEGEPLKWRLQQMGVALCGGGQ
jgi:hypothetical protein